MSSTAMAQSVRVVNKKGEGIPDVLVSGDTLTVLSDSIGSLDLSRFGDEEQLLFRHSSYTGAKFNKKYILTAGNGQIILTRKQTTLDPFELTHKWELEDDERTVSYMDLRPEDLALFPNQTAADMVGSTGKVFIQKSQYGGGSPMIRGFSANRILLVVDGVRMNNAIFRSGNLQNIISVDGNTIQSGEVIMGPGSVMYGSDALGGVIDFHTVVPAYTLGDSTKVNGVSSIQFASASEEKSFHGRVNVQRERFSLLTAFTVSDFGDLRSGSNGPDAYLRPSYVKSVFGRDSVHVNPNPSVQIGSGYEQINLLNKIRFQPMPDWDVIYGFHFSETSDIPRYDRLIEERNGTLRFGDWYYGPQKWALHNIQVIHNKEHKFLDRMKATFAYQNYQESRNDRPLNDNILRQRTERVQGYTVNVDLEKTLKDSSVVFYGGEFVLNYVGSLGWDKDLNTGLTGAIASRYPDNSSWESNSVYFSYKREINGSFNILGGIRYNQVWINAVFDTSYYAFPINEIRSGTGALSGTLGAVWRLSRLWKINANLASGFRAPNIDDIAKVFDSEPGSVVVPNPSLESEYAYSADIGFTYTDQDRVQLEISGFYTILDNAMVRADYLFNGEDSIIYDGQLSKVQAIVNADGAVIYGLVLAGRYNFAGDFWFQGAVNWTQGETTNSEPLRHVSPLFADGHVMYINDNWKVDAFVRYNGEMSNQQLAPSEQGKAYLYAPDENGDPYVPAWYTINLSASRAIGDFQLIAGIENISDVLYRPYSSGISAPGRNVYGSIKYRF